MAFIVFICDGYNMNSNALLSPQTRNPVGNIFACIRIAEKQI